MSKKKAKAGSGASTPVSETPSSALLVELDALRHEEDVARRSLRAWQILVQASSHSDFFVVQDFALEHDLVASCTAGTVWVNPVDGSQMVWIPPGPFRIGEDRTHAEAPGFSLARHPVTNAQFRRFREMTGYEPPATHPEPDTFLQHWTGDKLPKGQENHPVVYVSFIDAMHYCHWAGLTLPTEWLWEKAARGPEGRPFPWGDTPPDAKLANVNSNGVCAVGKHPRTRTPYGCEDLVGNISEWCQRTEDDDPAVMPQPVAESVGNMERATVRGSGYLRSKPKRMVSSHRRNLAAMRRNQWVGFRPASFLPCRPARG